MPPRPAHCEYFHWLLHGRRLCSLRSLDPFSLSHWYQSRNFPVPTQRCPASTTKLTIWTYLSWLTLWIKLIISSYHIQRGSKKYPPKTFLLYFHLWWTCVTENYLGYWPNIFLCLRQFWSIYLNISMNCIAFTSKTPQILTIQFTSLRKSWIFR